MLLDAGAASSRTYLGLAYMVLGSQAAGGNRNMFTLLTPDGAAAWQYAVRCLAGLGCLAGWLDHA